MNTTFDSFPNPALLQTLAKGSLEQSQNLIRAIRIWVLLRWLYSENGYIALSNSFTYADWRKTFFTENHRDEKQEDIASHQDSNCACTKTTQQWLSMFEVDIDKWQNSLQKQTFISNLDIQNLLKERIFAQVRKSLQSDFDLLVSRNWLQQLTNVSGRSKQYHRVEILPIVSELNNHNALTPKQQISVASALGMFSFLDPNLPLLAEQISEQTNEDNHRLFLYVDYVVPESSPLEDVVDQFQSELQTIWDSGNINPLLLTYRSAHQNLIKECVVYPVCIYFMEYAKYLCAYGSTPRGETNWYKYRLDRIVSKQIEPLNWQDPRVPQLLREQYEENRLPTPQTVNAMLKEAWGCDFYKEKALMILRFDQDFNQNYMAGISIHSTFAAIDYNRAAILIKQYTPNPEQRQTLLEVFQSRPTTDIYYQVYYRVTDYYVVRWLRALGSKVEVLLPWELRQQIVQDIQDAWNRYR